MIELFTTSSTRTSHEEDTYCVTQDGLRSSQGEFVIGRMNDEGLDDMERGKGGAKLLLPSFLFNLLVLASKP